MLIPETVPLENIYVPLKLRKTLDQSEVDRVAESLLAEETQRPIQVRHGKGRYVLVKGINRLEAVRALGEASIKALIVQARRA